MSSPDDDAATQRTPHGAEIPVPKRDDVFRDLRRVAKRADDSDASESGAKEQDGE